MKRKCADLVGKIQYQKLAYLTENIWLLNDIKTKTPTYY